LLVVAAPNPFRGITTIRFSMPEAGPATLAIHDVAGRRVRTLLDGAVGEGDRRFVWDGRDDTGRALASGVYFYRLQAAGNSRTGQVQLLK
jgi:flagellar hook assembly protein FlgD